LGCGAVWVLLEPILRRNVSPPSSGWKNPRDRNVSLVSDIKGGTHTVFENRVLKRFGPKKDEVTGGWRKLHNKKLHDLYSLPSIIRIIKSRRIR
jgi:hypothetical protein